MTKVNEVGNNRWSGTGGVVPRKMFRAVPSTVA